MKRNKDEDPFVDLVHRTIQHTTGYDFNKGWLALITYLVLTIGMCAVLALLKNKNWI